MHEGRSPQGKELNWGPQREQQPGGTRAMSLSLDHPRPSVEADDQPPAKNPKLSLLEDSGEESQGGALADARPPAPAFDLRSDHPCETVIGPNVQHDDGQLPSPQSTPLKAGEPARGENEVHSPETKAGEESQGAAFADARAPAPASDLRSDHPCETGPNVQHDDGKLSSPQSASLKAGEPASGENEVRSPETKGAEESQGGALADPAAASDFRSDYPCETGLNVQHDNGKWPSPQSTSLKAAEPASGEHEIHSLETKAEQPDGKESGGVGLYKTSLCSFFRKRGCNHGKECRYAHGEEELQQRPDGSWDPTSEKAKKKQREQEILAKMTTQNTANAEAANAEDEICDLSSDVLWKCVRNLPATWNLDKFKEFLGKNSIQYVHAKKKKGLNVGFLGFQNTDQVLEATKVVESLSVQRQQLSLADVLPRSWEKKAEDGKSLLNDLSSDQLCGKTIRDICDAVTPLAKIPYSEQLNSKKSALAQVLKRLARNTRKSCAAGVLLPDWIRAARDPDALPCELEDIIPSPIIDGYRNKCEFSIGSSTDGKRIVGFQLGNFREGITAIAEPSKCRNVSNIAQAFASALQGFVEKSDLPVWNKHYNSGFWRMLTVREGRGRKDLAISTPPVLEVMLIVQVCPVGIPQEKLTQEYRNVAIALSEAARKAAPQLPLTALLVQEHIGISNAAPADCPLIVLPVGEAFSGNADEVVGEESSNTRHIHDHILDLRFQISPTAFFQVNTLAAERLYSVAGEWARLGPDTLLFDVCCGTGTIGLTLAHHVGLVVGIEMNSSAVTDAWTNAKINGIHNCDFVCGKAEDVMKDMLDKYVMPSVDSADSSHETGPQACEDEVDKDKSASTLSLSTTQGDACPPAGEAGVAGATNDRENTEVLVNRGGLRKFKDVVVIVDPPRNGLHPVVLRTLRLHSQLNRIVYISCNPETLMANAVELCTPLDKKAVDKDTSKSRRNFKGMSKVTHARQRIKSMPESMPFRPIKAVGVDMFPHTSHCEMVMLLER